MITIAPDNVYIETRNALVGGTVVEKVFAFIAVPTQQRGGALNVGITPLVIENGELAPRTGKLIIKEKGTDA